MALSVLQGPKLWKDVYVLLDTQVCPAKTVDMATQGSTTCSTGESAESAIATVTLPPVIQSLLNVAFVNTTLSDPTVRNALRDTMEMPDLGDLTTANLASVR